MLAFSFFLLLPKHTQICQRLILLSHDSFFFSNVKRVKYILIREIHFILNIRSWFWQTTNSPWVYCRCPSSLYFIVGKILWLYQFSNAPGSVSENVFYDEFVKVFFIWFLVVWTNCFFMVLFITRWFPFSKTNVSIKVK